MSNSRSQIMKHANNSGSVRFHPSVVEIESKGGGEGEDNEMGYRSSSHKVLKPISGRRATGYSAPTDELEDERRQIRQLMSERKINYNQHIARKKGLEVNSTEDLACVSISDPNEVTVKSKEAHDHHTKQGFGAKLVGAMRFVKKHDHAGHDMDHSNAIQRTGRNHGKSSMEVKSEDEFERPEKGKYVTAPSLTEAFAPIFADGHGMFLPSTARDGANSHNFHKNLASLPKGNSSFAAIVQTAVQNQVVGGEVRKPKKSSKKVHSKKKQDIGTTPTEEDLEQILSDAIREKIHLLATSARRRVRDSVLKIADSIEEPEEFASRDGTGRPSIEQERPILTRSHESPRRQDSKKGTSKVHYRAEEKSDHDRRYERREHKVLNDEPLPFDNDGRIDAKTALKIVEAERHRGNTTHQSETIWIDRDGHQIDDPTTEKTKCRQRQLTRMPMQDGSENAAFHDEPLDIEQVIPEPVHKNKETRVERHNDRHGRPSLDSVRSEPQHRPTRDRSYSRHHTRLSEDNVRPEHHRRTSEDIPRSHGSSRHHRSRHERSHRTREPSLETNEFSNLDRAKTDETLYRHQRKTEEKERKIANQSIERSDAKPITEKEKHLNVSHIAEQTRSEESNHMESVEDEDENSAAPHHHRFKSLRALGHAIALGNSMQGKKVEHKSNESETKDYQEVEHTNVDVQSKYERFVDAHGETRLNEALDIAKMMLEHDLLEVQAEKRRHQTTVAALDPNANQKGVKGALKAVKNVTSHKSHHDKSGNLTITRASRTKASHTSEKPINSSISDHHQSSNPADDAYEQALRQEIKSKKERIKTSHFINDQNFGINGLV